MANPSLVAPLPHRSVLAVGGEDRVPFLQGLVSNDVAQATPGRAVWAALLTPQGRFTADFFIIDDGARLLLDTEADRAEDVAARLRRFRLRSRVTVDALTLPVHAAWGASPPPGTPPGIQVAADPRLAEAGWRVLGPMATTAGFEAWDRHRLILGLPDGSRDIEPERGLLLEAGFDELGGVSWTKGCYMGQELTARTRYRGLLKRRLVPVRVDGPLPPPGTPAFHDGQEVGSMRSGRDTIGLAMLRLEAITAPVTCGGATLTAHVPGWMRLSSIESAT